jgi:hypothetical protein
MSMRRFSVVEGDDAHGLIVGEGVVFDGTGGHGRAVVMPSDPELGYPTFYAGVEHIAVERPDHRVVFIDGDSRGERTPAADQLDLDALATAQHREQGADST